MWRLARWPQARGSGQSARLAHQAVLARNAVMHHKARQLRQAPSFAGLLSGDMRLFHQPYVRELQCEAELLMSPCMSSVRQPSAQARFRKLLPPT